MLLFLASCASDFLKYEKSEELKDIKEFEHQVKIEAPELPTENDKNQVASSVPSPVAPNHETSVVKPTVSTVVETKLKTTPQKKNKKEVIKKSDIKENPVASSHHEPELEGQSGFLLRRPMKDPFRVGEKIVHEVSYFSTTAGTLTMSVKPFAQVNDRRSYHFNIAIKTTSLFDMFHSVDDYVSTLVDFETFIPSVFTLHVKETNQLKEARFFYDQNKKQANYWEKKFTKENGSEEKKLQWEAADYSQNVFSAIYYMRVFQWEVGKENAFRVTDAEENLVFRGKGIRKEKLSTDIGDFNTIVIKPEIELRGKFKPVGDIYIWLSDDDRKYILRIESKIKIGTLVSEVVQLEPGLPDQGQAPATSSQQDPKN